MPLHRRGTAKVISVDLSPIVSAPLDNAAPFPFCLPTPPLNYVQPFYKHLHQVRSGLGTLRSEEGDGSENIA